MTFEGWKYDQRDLVPGEVELLERIWALAGNEDLDVRKLARFLTVKDIRVERIEVMLSGLRMLRAPGWSCMWNPRHTSGNTVHTIQRQKFDTDMVMMRMYLS